MSFSNKLNDQSVSNKNRLNDELVHKYRRRRSIPNKALEELALTIYRINGKGITFVNLIKEFGCSKEKAQRKLKNACKEKRDKNDKKDSILFTLENMRKNPQQYFPTCIKAEIIENIRKRKNSPINPTGDRLYQNPNFEQLKARYISELLSLLQNQPISIHKLCFKLSLIKNYYDEIDINQVTEGNKSKVHEEKIGRITVRYDVYPDGIVMIYVSCTNYPFKLEVEEDISSFFSFLGQVKDRLAFFLKDFSEMAIPPIMDWLLVQCDVNKDIPVNIVEQLSIPDLQLRVHDRIFRWYVKHIDGNAYYRIEESKQVNKCVGFGISEIMNTYNPYYRDSYDPVKFQYIQ